MSRIQLSNSVQRRLVAAVIRGCERSNQITHENAELLAFSKNIRGHIRTSACVPFMFQRFFGNAVRRMDNSRDTYDYVAIEADGYLIKVAHEPSTHAEYREVYCASLFPEDDEEEQKTLTLHFKTDESNRVSDIWLDGDGAVLPLSIDLAYSVSDDEEYYEAVAEKAPAFEPVAENAEAR